eukprot:Blabericola_migrator_1__6007@NODE_3028_length_2101_cov_52_727139_g1893_i0_p1_GENE_NODE_3028_length_2101_cov_52_727139_g1893_i0NODE_3028_length_2101_cov_52_727139_g1893_i0_p1_ORF_typecomplete_len290_score38_51DUF92/PF01940_16/5_9e44DUF1418/PF07214_12/0_36DUF1418/PF07214_12/2_7e03DUF1418/PF07214_12/7_6e03DUF2878/PF11086_8/6_7e02DUF2878/PF11086_8/4_2DUF2878/PF11086_8/13VIT1/PF01988_19/1_2e02VIT1/PF01988_19/0_71SecE/PF00584_20/7_7e03SecE/PF00584_20/1_1e02SecE/PF00584_20/2_4_NODE_3028_length_2101_cov
MEWLTVPLVVSYFLSYSASRLKPPPPVLDGWQLLMGLLLLVVVMIQAHRKQALTDTALRVGCVLMLPVVSASLTTGAAMAVFFFVADRATRYGVNRKEPGQERKTAYTTKHQVQRGVLQVVANGLVPAGFCLLAIKHSKQSSHLLMAANAAICGACADTLASEITPVLSDRKPCSILPPWVEVPVGSNGAVTLDGLIISFIGGCLPLLPAWACASVTGAQILFIAFCAFLGSLIDSFLGASLEQDGSKRWWKLLSNNDVNLLANFAAALAALHVLPSDEVAISLIDLQV